MAINLLEMLSSQMGGSQYSQIGKFLGADEGIVKSAMGAALPSILGSVISNGSTNTGAAGLINMLNKGNFDGSMLDNLGGLFGGGNATSSLMNSGSSILSSLMGNKLGSVVDMIGSLTGMKKSNSSSLMSMAAPLVMSMVGRYVKNKALDATGLSKFLGTQKKHVASALPAGMGNILGFDAGDIGSTVSNAANAGRAAVAETANAGGGILSKILPLALIALLAGGAYWFFTGKSATGALSDATSGITEGAAGLADKAGDMAGNAANAVKDGAAATVDAAGNAVEKAGEMAEGALDATTKAAREALGSIKFAAGSAGAEFSSFLAGGAEGDKSFRFKNLNFAVGSADISGETTEVDNLASVLKAYPSIKVQVAGYTDNTGNADKNKTLSEARATSVMNRLVAQGIDAGRITAKGFGDANPVADNSTKEGRAENRRIEISVMK